MDQNAVMLRRTLMIIATGAGTVIAMLMALRLGRAVPNPEESPIQDQIDRAVADRRHGWWVAEVLEAFGYLESDFGYRLTKVHLHFRGTFLYYEGSTFDVVIEYDPEDTGSVHAELWVHVDQASRVMHPRAFTVNDVLRARDPALQLPDPRRGHLEQAAVREAVSVWAAGLKELGPDVLRGAWPVGVRMGYLW
jgi:hypothetical protein